MLGPRWNDKFELPDESYYVSHIQVFTILCMFST